MANKEQGAVFPVSEGLQDGLLSFIKQALNQGCFDGVLIPARVAGGESFAHFLIQDSSLLEDACPISPIMTVQGAKALSAVTKYGMGNNKRIAVMLRPCEIRAAVELSKLGQLDLNSVILISFDCPGALPLTDWANDREKAIQVFSEIPRSGDENIRPLCQICDKFSATAMEDLHIGTLGTANNSILLVPKSPKGRSVLEKMGLSAEEDVSGWEEQTEKLTQERLKKKEQAQEDLKSKVAGLDNLLDTFSDCINCHNCMRVCPICYCQQCLFDSDKMKFPFEDYLMRAEVAGGLRLPPETMLFHIGRMLHMSLSCVSCGACEDACPVSIPVSQVFSMVGEANQEVFKYVPGMSSDEPLPLRVYQEEELQEVEQP
ncbi:MAG: 4Fe-4S dicluster domain-containing protein [Dehalococcoidia bacterium]